MKTALNNNEIPKAEDGNPFLGLYDLLDKVRIPVGHLATAIETHGVYGWDRFGRFGFFAKDAPQTQLALSALADARQRYRETGSYDHEDLADGPLSDFGWASTVAPEFRAISDRGPAQPERASATTKGDNSNLRIIGALLAFIESEVVESASGKALSQRELIGHIKDTFKVAGLSTRNLEDKFAKARQLLKDAAADT